MHARPSCHLGAHEVGAELVVAAERCVVLHVARPRVEAQRHQLDVRHRLLADGAEPSVELCTRLVEGCQRLRGTIAQAATAALVLRTWPAECMHTGRWWEMVGRSSPRRRSSTWPAVAPELLQRIAVLRPRHVQELDRRGGAVAVVADLHAHRELRGDVMRGDEGR